MTDPRLSAVLEGRERYTVLCADCLDMLRELPDCCVDSVVTDPPYDDRTHRYAMTVSTHVAAKSGSVSAVSGVPFEAIQPDIVLPLLLRIVRRWALVFCAFEDLGRYRDAVADHRWIRSGIYQKTIPTPQLTGDRPGQGAEAIAIAHSRVKRPRWNGHGRPGIWRATPEHGSERPEVPTPKPVRLMLQLIADFTDPDELILDPFCGSGTTGVACLRLGRRFLGIELKASWAELARERLRAESEHSTLAARKAGQLPLLGGSNG
jgi:site-specific DNA-methyltransferase (adenine-specific)